MALWPELRSPPFALLLAATARLPRTCARPAERACRDRRGTTASIVPGDILLLALAIVAVATVVRDGLPRGSWFDDRGGSGVRALLVVSGAANGSTAVVSAVKVTELTALGLGAAVLIKTRAPLEALVDLLLLFTIAADVVGAVRFVTAGGRQASFLGEHDFAALATLPLLYGLAVLFTGGSRTACNRGDRRGRPRLRPRLRRSRAWSACISAPRRCSSSPAPGGSSTLRRGRRHRQPWSAVVTAGTLFIRAGELSFLQAWFGKPESRPGQYAASWSQRLIYAYVGGRVFLAHPLTRHRLVRGAAAEDVCGLPPGRAAALRRPAAELLPAGDEAVHPAADLRPGAVRARARRRLCCAGGCSSASARAAPRAARRTRIGRATHCPPRGSPRRSARSPARACSAARRSPRSSGSSRGVVLALSTVGGEAE